MFDTPSFIYTSFFVAPFRDSLIGHVERTSRYCFRTLSTRVLPAAFLRSGTPGSDANKATLTSTGSSAPVTNFTDIASSIDLDLGDF